MSILALDLGTVTGWALLTADDQAIKDHDLILWATEIKVRAERKAGEMLAEMPKSKGAKFNGRAADGSFRQSHDDSAQTLAEVGVTPVQSSRWQALASMSEDHFEAAVATAKDTAGEVITRGAST